MNYADPEIIYFGLDNRLYTLGDCFLEVVSPVQPNTAAGRFLDRRGGDGGYMVIVQVDNLAQEQVRLADTGIRTVFADDRGNAKAIHLHPKDVPGAIPSLDEMSPPESWLWAGDGWEQRAGRHVGRILAAEIRSLDPHETGLRWAEAYGLNYSHRAMIGVLKWAVPKYALPMMQSASNLPDGDRLRSD